MPVAPLSSPSGDDQNCLQTLANILWMAKSPLIETNDLSQFTKSDIRYCSGCIYSMLEKHTGHKQITCQKPPAITKNNRINSFIHSLYSKTCTDQGIMILSDQGPENDVHEKTVHAHSFTYGP